MKTGKNFCGGCVKASPVFCGELRELSRRYSDSKQRFDADIIAGAVRCKYGRIQVLVCRPVSRKGRPFPTTFWLVCPYLVRRAGMVEAQQGVSGLEEYIRVRGLGREWREYNYLHQRIRLGLMGGNVRKFLRRFRAGMFRKLARSGVGGVMGGGVKCLHLQTASFLALGRHPAGKWLRSKGLFGDCGKFLCW